MADEERLWLVERTYGDKGLVTLVYATVDGECHLRMQRSTTMLRREPVTAAVDAAADRLRPVEEDADRERYAVEAGRMAERHEPDDAV